MAYTKEENLLYRRMYRHMKRAGLRLYHADLRNAHKEEWNQKRREQYANDAEYRRKVKERMRRNREARKARNGHE